MNITDREDRSLNLSHPPDGATASRRDRSLDLSATATGKTQIVVQMHGEPGSGKSSVARELGARLGFVVIDKDVIKAALLRANVGEALAGPASYDVFFAQAHAFIASGHSIVLDNPLYWDSVERRWLEIAQAAGSPPILIECTCPDRDELSRRLRTREIVESQLRKPLDLIGHPGSRETEFQPRLKLDTTRPLAAITDDAVAYIEYAVASPPITKNQSPITSRP